uniref:Uncharacterized protein n=1 Tax=Lactuca sativa TaxID=4236 RepID=A0A9R1W8G6_LACSA|nr:hypothetical protein LSAT_V11C200056940 [Lactuca sativa]
MDNAWVDEDECITDGISEEKLGETCNYMGKQISIWMMKLEQEKNFDLVFRQEFDKLELRVLEFPVPHHLELVLLLECHVEPLIQCLLKLLILNWNNSMITYIILWLCGTMFSSSFALVPAYAVKGIVLDKRVWPMLYSVSVEMDVDWVPASRWING